MIEPSNPKPRMTAPAATPAVRAAAEARGRAAEDRAAAALVADGFVVLARRCRTPAGELDLVAARDGLLAFCEVKARKTLTEAAFSLAPRQQARLLAAGEWWLGQNPGQGAAGVRFDVLLVDVAGRVRRVVDAFRLE
ncbi:YraN family protein [Humitalea sp. 24SJ18S-53]|uniref:YraN family protein n=1 Tax=Humitalea sp. 24SJ18S-53 TaxID=3422307 RepID=UPI003D66C2F4